MEINLNFCSEIETINWFTNCNTPTNFDLNIPTKQISNWSQAQIYYTNPNWEDTTLEASNNLTEYLSLYFRSQFQEWNSLASQAKKFLNTKIKGKIMAFKEENGLDQVFVDCIMWDLVHAIVEDAYRSYNPPTFFVELLEVYKMGNFPCGWEGQWPQGKLVIL